MFEKCGIMDVFYGIWKQKWLILAVTVLFALAGFGISMLNAEPSSDSGEQNNNMTWVASASYLVTDTGEISGNSGETLLARNQQKAYGVLNVATADYKRAQILDGLLKTYTAEQITEGLDLDVSPELLTFYALGDVVNGSVPSGTSIVHLFLTGSDEKIVSDYMELLKTVVEETAVEIGECEVRYVDGVVGQKSEDSETGLAVEISPARQGILFCIVGFILAVLAVVAKAIFWPTVNRRSDFAAYDLAVLGEIRIGK